MRRNTLIGFVAIALTALCLQPSRAHAEITTKGGTAYAARCEDAGVPLPPQWGGPSSVWRVVPRRTVPPNPNFPQGHFADTYNFGNQETFAGTVWYWEAPTKGVCIVAAHDGRNFDVICQGKNGKACFWEGTQNPTPPATAVTIASRTQATTFVKGGIELANAGVAACTRCHGGQNVFITHYDLSTDTFVHPTNNRTLTGWMPDSNAIYDPIVPTGWRENPVETFPGYPASTTACTSCHQSGGLAGVFPQLSQDLEDKYCLVLKAAANQANIVVENGDVVSRGGMPPTDANKCVTDVSCAAQTDPFVKGMLDVGCQSPASTKWGVYAADRVVNDGWSVSNKIGKPSGRTFAFSSNPTRLTPTVFTSLVNTTSWNRLLFDVGTGSETTFWLKGSLISRVTSWFEPVSGVREFWEYDDAIGAAPARNVTASASVSPAGAPWGHRRHNAKSVIFYLGTDNGLHRLDYSSPSWGYAALPRNLSGMGDSWVAHSDPTAFKRSTGSDSVLYRPANCSACIAEYRFVGSTSLFNAVNLGFNILDNTLITGLRDQDANAWLFATTVDGIYALRNNTTDDRVFAYTTPTRLPSSSGFSISSPRPFWRADGKLAVAWLESDRVHEAYWDGLLWRDINVTGTGKLENEGTVGDAVGYVNTEGKDTIVFRGRYGQGVYQYVNTSGSTWTRTQIHKP